MLDAPTIKLRKTALQVGQDLQLHTLGGLTQRFQSLTEKPVLDASGHCSAADAQAMLSRCRQLTEGVLLDAAKGIHPFDWLYLLRRMPLTYFWPVDEPMASYSLCLAEVSTCLVTSKAASRLRTLKNSGLSENWCEFDEESVRSIVRLAAVAGMLTKIHNLIHTAYIQNLKFRIGADGLPEPVVDDAEIVASREWNKRSVAISRSTMPLLGSGLPLATSEVHSLQPLADQSDRILALSRMAPDAEIDAASGGGLQFAPMVWSLKQLRLFNAKLDTAWWQPEAPALILLLRVLLLSFLKQRNSTMSLLRTGYLPIQSRMLKEILKQHFFAAQDFVANIMPKAKLPRDEHDLIKILSNASGSLWPRRYGPAIRPGEGFALIDIFAATGQLSAALEFPHGSGQAGHARGMQFETTVQAVIDATSWRPCEQLQSVRDLKRDGKLLTDVDAVGAKDGTLLIVQCMSTVLDGNHLTFDTKALLNDVDRLEKKCQTWHRLEAEFRAKPKEGNYDFSAYKEIICIVCTPLPLPSLHAVCNEEAAPGLPRAVSLPELLTWLTARDEN